MNRRNRRGLLLCLLLVVGNVISGCSMQESTVSYQDTDFAMGTVISQNIYGEEAEQLSDQVLEQIRELEQTISFRVEDSDIARINEAAGTGQAVSVSQKTIRWLSACQDVWNRSGHTLDITVGAASRLWDIGGENPRIPEKEELEQALKTIGGDRYDLEGECVLYSQSGGQLDLGAVGKGIACDEIAAYLDRMQEEVGKKTNGTFSVGGSVLIYGCKPDSHPWRIGIRDPLGQEGETMASLTFALQEGEKMFVSTSGDYEKYFEQDGVRYHHILDPKTAAPADSDLISVTVISTSGFLSDALSTACFVAGKENAMELAEVFQVDLILIDHEQNVTVTEGAAERLTILNEEYRLEDEEK